MAARTTFSLVVIAGVALIGYMYLGSTSQKTAVPPTPEQAAAAGPMADVIVPELTGRAVIGKAAFNAKCAVCHGQNAAGQNGIAPPLIHQYYRPGHHGDNAFQRAAKGGVQAHHWTFGNMPPIQGVTPGDVKAIVAYIRTLQQANGIN